MGDDDTYCDTCYSAAAKHGRSVRDTSVGRVCAVCEQHLRNGLIHYRPSNGSEGYGFFDRCSECRHCTDTPDDPLPPKIESPYNLCQYGIMDRVMRQMIERFDHICHWFDPADITREGRCLRFTDRNDPNGSLRDPPRPDCEGQMFFGELLTVPEVVPLRIRGRVSEPLPARPTTTAAARTAGATG